ncbi:uncharacterized protein LOC117174542 isoform X2 [Belonocnema kinseyi]|uniref:uncharacterized protein LOC117174542 isoform X2 n=1 Tax=Belonocnema kinseyi TaxID=2817044 RepID=UPI00143DA979|nr:uncharacterized protein LOC117174542 isoform X2 [Belonocnema kinseyi]
MGNHMTRKGSAKKKAGATTGGVLQVTTKTMSRSPSGTDIQNGSHTQFLPIDNLAKILAGISLREESVHGITASVIKKYLFPHHPELAERLFIYFHWSAKASTPHLGTTAFRQQAEKFLSVMNDDSVLESYVKIYSNLKEEGDVTPQTLKSLLMVSYTLAMGNDNIVTLLSAERTFNAVLISCFHGKESLSVSFVSNWLWQNCPRIIQGLHRYVVHVLTTAYRFGNSLLCKEESQPQLEPATPVLEQPPDALDYSQPFLPISYVWLLSTSLPSIYTQSEDSRSEGMQALIDKMSGNICPRHWTLLYNSDQHGTGVNRFLHHVLGYKGPTLIFIRAVSSDGEKENCPTYCICSTLEWRESHLYWGDEDSMVIELLPSYRVIEKGPKLLYLNTGIRGYPQGLRAGKDPREPSIIVDQAFNSVTFERVPYRISSLEVWGCGDTKSREKQLEIKKWQVKEAEKQRVVKLSATEWLDHPDRYLLELGGRQTYNNSSS